MAKHLARIHGTEEDKVNCPFYFKIGACRHSDRCSRLHHKPAFSPTLLVKHIYRHPVRQAELQQAASGGGGNSNLQQHLGGGDPAAAANAAAVSIDKEQALEDFLCFFEDMYMEFSKFGRIEALHVVDNLGDHMIGHVYVKFSDEEEASDALQVMNGRYYDGRPMEVEFSPVTDFREARCRDYDEESCSRGGFCNFLHVKPVPMCLIASMDDDCEADRRREQDERRQREDREQQRRGHGSSGSSKRRSKRGRDRDGDDDDGRRHRKHHRRSKRRSHSDDEDSYSDQDDRGGGRSSNRSPLGPP